MKQLNLPEALGPELDIRDPILKKRLEALNLRRGYRLFGRVSFPGLHEIGIEKKDKADKNRLPLIAFPGLCHGNWSYIRLIEGLSKYSIETSALSPYGESQSKTFDKPIEELTLEDYIIPYQSYLSRIDAEVVLMGHSLGALLALKLKERMKDQIGGLIILGGVKPSNMCSRTYSFSEEAGVIWKPIEHPEWINDDLFQGDFPPEIKWFRQKICESIGSNNVLDDYRGDHGKVDPNAIDCPILEFVGERDVDETTGIMNEITHVIEITDELKKKIGEKLEPESEGGEKVEEILVIKEPVCKNRFIEKASLVQGQRLSIADFFRKYGQCPYGETHIIPDGTHDGILLGRQADQVAAAIGKNYRDFFG